VLNFEIAAHLVLMVPVFPLDTIRRITHGNNVGGNVGEIEVEAFITETLLFQGYALAETVERTEEADDTPGLFVVIIFLGEGSTCPVDRGEDV
jgi:hypothetical protein